ncbi:GDP-mannose 4,6-dehydratase [Nocardioides jishulii]|uniref:GDP-mannose 4,6-dehydratase n=1 Tax=Nocardioides jishulii TaxID=2575440 RepID=UPI0014854031|nr:GDP-mannose 4,6-dehydratase [Nocardioides jishulii]
MSASASGGRALITGVAGQDGSYLAEQLLADGVEVHGLVRRDDATTYVPEGATLHVGDVTDPESTRALLNDLGPDLVVNLAAMSSVAQSWSEPELSYAVNAEAAMALLETVEEMADNGHEVRFVQASSAELFGSPTVSPQDESTLLAPTNPYGVAKATAHRAVAEARARGLHASSLILYNHESPRRPATFVTRKITMAAAAIARGEADDLALGNLDARRDWGWAPDYADAMVRAGRAEAPGDYVIATGVSHSVRDFVAAAFTAAGVDDWEQYVRVDPDFFRPADATELVGDASRARRALGWAPTRTFEQVVAAMVAADLG